jgi:plasmid stability protein
MFEMPFKSDIMSDTAKAPMGQILVRNIKDSALETLRVRAVQKGSSLEAEVRRLIESEGAPDRAALVDEMRLIRAKTPGTVPSLTSAEYQEGLE